MDTFGHSGCPLRGAEFDSDGIDFNTKVLYAKYSSELNHEYYSREGYILARDIFFDKYDSEIDFVEHELKTLPLIIDWIKECFVFYNIDLNNINFRKDACFPNNPNDKTKTYYQWQFGSNENLAKLAEMYVSFTKTSSFLQSKLPKAESKEKTKHLGNKPSSFGYRYDEGHLIELYKKLKFKVLHDDTTETQFVDVLSKDWKSHTSLIKFECTIALAAALIDYLKPKFKNLNRSTAGASKMFASKKGTIITRTSFDTSIAISIYDNLQSIKEILI